MLQPGAITRERSRGALATAKWRANNPDKVKAANARRDPEKLRQLGRKRYSENVEKLRSEARARRKMQYQKNPEAEIQRATEYRAANLLKVNARLRRWAKKKRETDPVYRLKLNLRTRLSKAIRRQGTSGRGASSIRGLGCSREQLVQHIQCQFVDGMGWENYGVVWHIDHIVPLSAFDLSDPSQCGAACHYTNLQPLFAAENIRKGGVRPRRPTPETGGYNSDI